MNIQGFNSQAAIRNFVEKLRLIGFGKYSFYRDYQHGHVMLKSQDRSKPVFYAIYKRDFFQKFDNEFPEFVEENPKMKGDGESINSEALSRAINSNCTYLVFVHPSNVYVVYPMLVQKYCIIHNLIRGQRRLNLDVEHKTGNFKPKSEVTFSFPVKLMRTFEQEFKVIEQ